MLNEINEWNFWSGTFWKEFKKYERNRMLKTNDVGGI